MKEEDKFRIIGCEWAQGLVVLLRDTYGINAERSENGFLLSASALKKLKVADILVRHHELDITVKDLISVAQKMVQQISNDFPPTSKPLRDSINVLGSFGNLSKIDEFTSRLSYQSNLQLVPTTFLLRSEEQETRTMLRRLALQKESLLLH